MVHVTGLDVRPGAEVPTDSGTGLVWDVGGHIVTSSHVVERGGRAAVTLQDGGTYPATIVGSDHDRELAVLKIDAPRDKLRPLPLGASNALEIGQSVIAIGNPFGLDTTLTSGTIVALGREASGAGDPSGPICLIQTVAINAGNRGGPLLDASGRVIGVNLEASTGDAGRAVPIDAAREIVARLLH